jgi:5'(3')-deoxyribonucleotidase
MLSRLKRNQIKFDAHMNGMEDTYKSVKKEWEEVSEEK